MYVKPLLRNDIMGIRLSFFKTPQHRVFNYTPIYYDERKERMQERLDAIEKEKAEKEGREWKNERYIPGRNIKGNHLNLLVVLIDYFHLCIHKQGLCLPDD